MFRCFLLCGLLVACSEDVPKQGTEVLNTPPTASITSHSDGAQFDQDETVVFDGTVADTEDESLVLTVEWYSGAQLLCGPLAPTEEGQTSCSVSMSEGMSDIRLDVTDGAGETSSAAISIDVLSPQAPTVQILQPSDDSLFYSTDLIVFEAQVGDSESAASDLILTWTSSIGGQLPLTSVADDSGLVTESITLVSGQHNITLTAEDDAGMSGSDTISIVVQGPNEAPVCAVNAPLDESVFLFAEPILFSVTATDINQSSDTLNVMWSSSIDGEIGNTVPDSEGLSLLESSDLSIGTHLITVEITDNGGLSCTDQRTIVVGAAPAVSIDAPLDGAVLDLGDVIPFSATVSDGNDAPSQLLLEWSSSIDGVFSTQSAPFSGTVDIGTRNLSAGNHTIVLEATNTSGFSGSASIQLRVNTPPDQPTVVLTPSPAYVTDSLTATVSAGDADGDAVTYSYEWLQNGNATSYTSPSVPASATVGGDRWTLRTTPNDGFSDGPSADAFVDIFETGPSIYGLSISPNSGVVTGLTLSCSASASDSIQGMLVPNYVWMVNGQSVSTSQYYTVNSLDTDPGDTVTCTASAVNANGVSVSASTSVLVENTSPLVSSVSIQSSLVFNDDVVQCSATVVDPDESPAVLFVWHESTTPIGTGQSFDLATAAIYPNDVLRCYAHATDGSGASHSQFAEVIIEQRAPIAPTLVISPSDPEPGVDDLLCSATGASDPDGLPIVTTITWTSSAGATVNGDTVLGTDTSGGETWTCTVEVSDGTSTTTVSDSVDVNGGFAQGVVRRADSSTWVDVSFELCGPAGTCNANAAKSACSSIGKKVVAHGSNGTNDVYDLGATASCNWSISYYEVYQAMPPGACLVGVSNLEWSDCCGTTSWHGNTRTFGSPNTIFGYVANGNSGYVGSYSNSSGTTWGCTSESSAASNNSNCTEHYVACAN